MTDGVAETIAANHTAEKIFIGNVVCDVDIQEPHLRSGWRRLARLYY